MSVSESEKGKVNALLGEALAIRAYAYWNLIRFYGDVPFTTVPTSELTTFTSSRTDRDVIYDQCIADLQKAVELLPWQGEANAPSTPERFCKNSAYGILARVALYAAGYSLRWDLNTYDASTLHIARRDDAARVKELYQIAADACKAVIESVRMACSTTMTSCSEIWATRLTTRKPCWSMVGMARMLPM